MGIFLKGLLGAFFGGWINSIITLLLIGVAGWSTWQYVSALETITEQKQTIDEKQAEIEVHKNTIAELEDEVRRNELRVKEIADSIAKRAELERDLRREIDHRKRQLSQLKRTDPNVKAWAEDAYRGTAIQY